MRRKIAIFLCCLLLISCQIPMGQAPKLKKLKQIIESPFYLHREKAFGEYLNLNPQPPIHNDNYTLSKYVQNNTFFDVPLAWISPPFPLNKTVHIEHDFKYSFYVNCSDYAFGILYVGFWRYRNGIEKFWLCSGASPTIRNSSCPTKLIWFKNVNQTFKIQQGDRLIVKFRLYSFIQGRYFLGISCKTYPTFIKEPETTTLRPISIDYNPFPASAHFGFPEVMNTSIHLATDDVIADNDSSYSSTRGACPPWGCTTEIATYRLNLPDGIIPSGSIVHSVTHFFVVRREVALEGNLRLGIYIDASYSWDSWAHPPVLYASYSKEWLENPSSGQNWTSSNIDDLRATCQLYGSQFMGIYFFTRCTQHYVVVEYTPLALLNWGLILAILTFFAILVIAVCIISRRKR